MSFSMRIVRKTFFHQNELIYIWNMILEKEYYNFSGVNTPISFPAPLSGI